MSLDEFTQTGSSETTVGQGHDHWCTWASEMEFVKEKNEWSLEVLRESKSSLKPGESTGVGEGRGGDQRIET